MTLEDIYRQILASFGEAKLDNAPQEARWLIEAALEKEAGFLRLHPTSPLSHLESEKITRWAQRRLKGEPLSRLKGMREFWSLPFALSPDTLDPRPETEILVDAVLFWLKENETPSPHILDLGTGSGCLLISLLHEWPTATGVGIDLSKGALETAALNAHHHQVSPRLQLIQGNWAEGLTGAFDIIVSNPPYIPLKDKPLLNKDVVEFDPPLALFGGEDGLEAYRTLCPDIKRLLKPKGLAALEIGAGQRHAVEQLFHEIGFETLFVLKDLAQHDRVLGFHFPP